MSSDITLSQQLIRLIRDKKVSGQDLQRASVMTLDALANTLAGRNSKPGRLLLEWGRTQAKDAGRQAFVAGGLTHILETDDLHRESVTHPGCIVVPAVLALSNETEVDGPAFLTAVLHGYEAMCRIGNAVGPTHYKIWHNTATCGPFGSAMAACAIGNISDEQAMHALGNAGTQSSGFWEFLETGAMSKHLHAGRAAESGIIATQLAALGFTGPPAILEGPKGFFSATCPDATPAAVLADPERPWELTETSIKPWPCCRHTHPVIDAALEIHAQIDSREIESVEIETYRAALDVCNRPQPENEYSAKFSLHHTAALALTKGEIQFDSFDAATREDMAVLRAHVSVSATEPYVSAYPDAWGACVTVRLIDGEQISAERMGALGDPGLALSDDQMIAKATTMLSYAGLEDSLSQKLIDGVLKLPAGGSSRALVSLIAKELR